MLLSAKGLAIGAALFALGVIAGWVAANRLLSARASISTMGEAHAFAQMAAVQYDNADADSARAALNSYLRYLETQPGGPLSDTHMIAGDKALTLARLALLEERQHNAAGAEGLWVRAEKEAKAAGWQDSSRKRIREIVEQIDSGQTRKSGS